MVSGRPLWTRAAAAHEPPKGGETEAEGADEKTHEQPEVEVTIDARTPSAQRRHRKLSLARRFPRAARGLELGARYRMAPWLFADADLTLVRARFRENPGTVALAPTRTFTAGVAARPTFGSWTPFGAARVKSIADRPATEDRLGLASVARPVAPPSSRVPRPTARR